jgi:hypothetical protein
MARILLNGRIQQRERLGELMAVLHQLRAHDEDIGGDLRVGHRAPGRQSGFPIAHVARVAAVQGQVEIAPRQIERRPGIPRIGSMAGAQGLQLALYRVPRAAREPFQYDAIVGGAVGGGRGRPRPRNRRGQEQRQPRRGVRRPPAVGRSH